MMNKKIINVDGVTGFVEFVDHNSICIILDSALPENPTHESLMPLDVLVRAKIEDAMRAVNQTPGTEVKVTVVINNKQRFQAKLTIGHGLPNFILDPKDF